MASLLTYMNICKFVCALLLCAVSLFADPAHFNLTGNLTTARSQHSATLLRDGKILLAGGINSGTTLTSANLYDPVTGLVTAASTLSVARQLHTATLLLDGRVLVAGGTNGATLSSAEIYDPATGNWTLTGSLGAARYQHTATLLDNGMVLIAGGQGAAAAPLDSAELYDPATGQFTATGTLSKVRQSHTATLLPGGKVLIVGGLGSGGTMVQAAELYNPSLGTFGSTGSIITGRYLHTATVLATGKVLIAGGFSGSSSIDSAEIYDPAGAGTFSATGNMTSPRYAHTANLLPNGKVLIVGGFGAAAALSTAELYDPAGSFTATQSMASARIYATATLVPTGSVIVAGGQAAGGVDLASTERYDASTAGTFSATAAMAPRNADSATLLPDGQVLIAGGDADYYFLGPTLASALLYEYSSGTFTATGSLNIGRSGHTGTLLTNGKVLVAGGTNGSAWAATAELYNPASGTFTPTGALNTPRTTATATLLANGKVLIAGGTSGAGTYEASAEIYDPVSGTFATTGNMSMPRHGHSATLLANGTVLIAGGFGNGNYTATAEAYDPLTGLFSPTGSMNSARSGHTATLLASGKVLIAGGDVNQLVHLPTEIYNPAAFSFSLSAATVTASSLGVASVLPNGKVLLAGGYGDEGVISPNPGSIWYDPVADFAASGPPLADTNPRTRTATMLPNGKVLVSGTPAAELYDCGIGYTDARRPVITSAPSTLVEPAAISLTGSALRGDSEASGGSFNNSASNVPLLLLQRVDNDQLLTFGAGAAFSSTSFTSTAVSGVANGHYRMRLVVNGISSLERVILITGDPTITSITPNGGPAAGGESVTITGTNLGGTLSIGGVTTSYTGTPSSITFMTPAHATGAVDVTVTTINGSVTLTGGYTYFPLPAPSGFSAMATSASEVSLSWTPSSGATGYEVWRSSLHAPYAKVLSVTGTSTSDFGLSADTSYLYKVRATGPSGTSAFTAIDPATTTAFTDSALTGAVIKAAHITELRTAVNAMRAAAGLTEAFTGSAVTAGMLVARAHLVDLRTALDAARTAIGLPAIIYADPTITAGTTLVKAVHLTQLRDGTQ